jgi:predicted RNA binding protein YcfA (HicA-like mRNA interferase family)
MPKITPIPSEKFRKVIERAGFACVKIEGDHYIYTKKGALRPVVIPRWKSLPVFIIKNCLRTAGVTREEYFSIIEEL